MDHSAITAAVAEMGALLRQDGADLRVVSVDDKLDRIELVLDVENASCAECILPPEALLSTVESALRQRVPQEFELVLADPRRRT